MRHALLFALLTFMVAAEALAQPSPVLIQRIEDVRRVLNGEREPEGIFAPAFLVQVPSDRLKSLSKEIVGGAGMCRSLVVKESRGPFAAVLTGQFALGVEGVVSIEIESQKPHRVVGLLINSMKPVGRSTDRLDSLIGLLRALPGTVSFAIVRLADGRTIGELNADSALAIGSAFKLYILGEIVARANEGRARWSDIVTFDSAYAMAGATLSAWPHGAPLTLHTAATLMISQSDNTATDLLLFALGRESVERRMRAMGNRVAEGNVPFLSTREAFKLKTMAARQLRILYAAGDTARRRALLAALDTVSIQDPAGGAAPRAIETIEWFASARELCAAMDALRTATAGDSTARGIMAVNPGLLFNDEIWEYVGYKGGSEPGVLNLTFLLKARSGEWYAVSAGWNNQHAEVDQTRFTALVQRILNIGPWK